MQPTIFPVQCETLKIRSYARVFGIVLNHRNVENENQKVEEFSKEKRNSHCGRNSQK